MRKSKKFFVGMFVISIVCIMMQTNKSNAALQSNGGTPAEKDLSTWMLQIRQMQELGGTLGRTDTVDTTDLKSNTTDLDIHLQKNTEYGAMAILSASAYGNPNPIGNGETTTGNSTGIVMNLNYERVAAGSPQTDATNFKDVASRYKNIYNNIGYDWDLNSKIGDAMLIAKWHGGKYEMGYLNYEGFAMVRSFNNSIFSCRGHANDGTVNIRVKFSSRAALVVGAGI